MTKAVEADGPRGALRRALPWLAYVTLAVIVTWPVLLEPTRTYVGGVRTDATNTLWNAWFVAEALGRGQLPLHTTLLDHPDGGRLFVADPLNCLLAVPLTWGFGATAAWGVLATAHVAFAGLAAHHLGVRLGGRGWIAGVGYALAPIALSHLQNGSSEAVSTGWLPVAALGLLDAADHGGVRRVVTAGFGLFVCALAGWYGGVGAFVLGGVALAGSLWAGALGDDGARRTSRRVAGACVLGLALTAPLAAAFTSVAVAEDGLVDIKNEADLARIRRTLGAADPRSFALPGDFRSPDFERLTANPSDRVHTTYLGFALLGLAAWGLWRDATRRAPLSTGVWVAAGATAAVLAMGPVVVNDGAPLAVAGRALPLPYALLERLPGFGSLSLLYRLATLTSLALAVVADRAPLRGGWIAAACLAIGLEVKLWSPVAHLPQVSTLPDLPALEALAAAPHGAVLNLPVQAGRNYLWEQTLHGKPVCGSLNSGANRAALRVMRALRALHEGEGDLAAAADTARASGVRYAVVHRNAFTTGAFDDAILALRRSARPLSEDSQVIVYALW